MNGAYFNTTVVATTQVLDTIVPTTPANLEAAVISNSETNLAWTASTNNVGITGYGIELLGLDEMDSDCADHHDQQQLQQHGAGSENYRRVRTFDAAGNRSTYSNIVTAATPK